MRLHAEIGEPGRHSPPEVVQPPIRHLHGICVVLHPSRVDPFIQFLLRL
jgi:hypothetical protein